MSGGDCRPLMRDCIFFSLWPPCLTPERHLINIYFGSSSNCVDVRTFDVQFGICLMHPLLAARSDLSCAVRCGGLDALTMPVCWPAWEKALYSIWRETPAEAWDENSFTHKRRRKFQSTFCGSKNFHMYFRKQTCYKYDNQDNRFFSKIAKENCRLLGVVGYNSQNTLITSHIPMS